VTSYLNRKDVREALHVRPDAGVWSVCTDEINYSTEDLLSSMLPLYPRLIAAGLRVWIFSGDVDGIVPTSGSRAWVEGLQLRETEHWRPWLVPDGAFGPQVGGYVVGYDGLTFATVRGAGHMVPYTQPARAAHLFKAFVNDAPL
jgi:serine carboxypeptidase-like clade 2